MKLFTSALALDQFGPTGRFETQVLRSGALRPDGTLDGDLVLRGAGDPTLGGRFADEAGTLPMVTLARSVAAAGVRRVSGALVGDASGFDDGKVPDGSTISVSPCSSRRHGDDLARLYSLRCGRDGGCIVPRYASTRIPG